MVFGYTIPFLGGGIVSGIWLAFIGWFINSAAAESYRQVVVEDMLQGVPVARLTNGGVNESGTLSWLPTWLLLISTAFAAVSL